MKSRDESIREELELREEEIRLKIESILDEEDDEVRTARIKRLNSHELDVLNERMDEINEKNQVNEAEKQSDSALEAMLERGVKPQDSYILHDRCEFIAIMKNFVLENFTD